MTTLVKKDWFGSIDTDMQAQLIANSLAITPEFFAELSCEGDRLFGVVTNCRRETCQNTCETVLNGCARKNLWQYSYMVQQELEATLGWTLSPRYITETLPWDGSSRIKLTFGGIEKLFVSEAAVTIQSDILYNPAVHQTLALAVIGQSYVEILVPFEYLSQPEGVMMRNPNTGKAWAYTPVTTYPQIRFVGPVKYWAIAIPGGNAIVGDTIDVYDCLWGYIDEPVWEEDDCTGEVAIVYENSVQKIPVEKITDDRWYIKHRNMVRAEYQGDEIDLTQFQFHKLYDVVDLACFTEVCELITIRKKCVGTVMDCECSDDTVPCESIEADGCATVVNAKSGIIEVHEVEVITDDAGDPVLDANGCPTFRQKTDCDSSSSMPYEVTVSYKTNPVISGINHTSAVETLRRAIAARVAAEVNLIDCGCDIECGFFKEMRVQTNTQVFTQGGSVVVALRFGNKMGQQVYALALETAPRDTAIAIA